MLKSKSSKKLSRLFNLLSSAQIKQLSTEIRQSGKPLEKVVDIVNELK